MIQDFHKTKAVFIFFKDVLSVDPSDHDMIDVGYALSSCDPRHADHPETVYHAGSREEKQKRNEKGRPYRSEEMSYMEFEKAAAEHCAAITRYMIAH